MDPANANNLPEATHDDIEKEFVDILDFQDETTTLDVKNSLRTKGFWVSQVDVSETIAQFVRNSSSTYTFCYDQGHKVYSKNRANNNSPASTSTAVPAATPQIGDWEVFAKGGALGLTPTEQYTNCTRNKARYTYSKQYDVAYVDTIAKKV